MRPTSMRHSGSHAEIPFENFPKRAKVKTGSISTAREALEPLRDIAIDEMASSELDETLAVAMRDETGKPVYSASLNIAQPLAT